MSRLRLAFALMLIGAMPVAADEASEKLKKAAAANLAKAEVTKTATVETDSLIVCSTLPEAKTKALADQLQKVHALGRKVLQFEEKDDIWKGKLTVYYLPETKAYKNFVRSVAQSRPDESYFFSLRSDPPFVVESAGGSEKATEPEQFGEAGSHIAAALLVNKGGTGTTFPEWVKGGLGRAISLRAEGPTSKRYGNYKAASRRVVLGGGKGVPISEVWEGKGKDSEVLATSLMDYIAFGPGQSNFLKFINGFRPTENNQSPGVPQALEAAMWKQETLEAAWKKWVQAGT
jgi:hypothetical protein